MSIVFTQFYLRLLDLYLVAYMDFFPEDKMTSFYQCRVLYNNFGDVNTICQLCCLNRYLYATPHKNFIVLLCGIHLYVFRCGECLCECARVCLCILCMHVFIVGQ